MKGRMTETIGRGCRLVVPNTWTYIAVLLIVIVVPWMTATNPSVSQQLSCMKSIEHCQTYLPYKDAVDSLFLADKRSYVETLCRAIDIYKGCIKKQVYERDCRSTELGLAQTGFSLRGVERAIRLTCLLKKDYLRLHWCFTQSKNQTENCFRKRKYNILSVLTRVFMKRLTQEQATVLICKIQTESIMCAMSAIRKSSCNEATPAAAFLEIIEIASLLKVCIKNTAYSNVIVLASTLSNSVFPPNSSREAELCYRKISAHHFDSMSLVLHRQEGGNFVRRCRLLDEFSKCMRHLATNSVNVLSIPMVEPLLLSLQNLSRTVTEYVTMEWYYKGLFEQVWSVCNIRVLSQFYLLYDDRVKSEKRAKRDFCGLVEYYNVCVVKAITDRRCVTDLCVRLQTYVQKSRPRICIEELSTITQPNQLADGSTKQPYLISVIGVNLFIYWLILK